MRGVSKKPFFARFWLAAGTHLLIAAGLTAIQFLDVLTDPYGGWEIGQSAPTFYRAPSTQRAAEEEVIRLLDGEQGDDRFIVRRGEKVTLKRKAALDRLMPERKAFDLRRASGGFAFVFLALVFFNLVLRRYGQHLLLRARSVATMVLLLGSTVLTCRLLLNYTGLSIYALPAALPALLLTPLIGQNMGFALHLLSVALVAPMVSFMPGMVLVPLVSGWGGVLLLNQRSGLVRTGLAAVTGAALGALFLFGLDLFAPNRIDFGLGAGADLAGLLGGMLACGVVATLLFYPAHLLFGAVPRFRYRKLLNLDNPLLRELSEKAPGTFQHSLAMANMAEKVAEDIRADAQLARAGAYYHDIGKMQDPEYFIENQKGSNPHDKLAPEGSAEKLRAHVQNGLAIAHGAGLPARLADFIVEHHGHTVMEYFLNRAMQQNGKADAARFTYPGRNPTSKETAILMIVDAVEAASRTLKDPSRDDLENLVRRILFTKVLDGIFDESGLTIGDLRQVGLSLMRYLEGQFHVRVIYPWQKKDAGKPDEAPKEPIPEAAPEEKGEGPTS